MRFDPASRVLLGTLGMGRGRSVVEVHDMEVRVNLGWGFRAVIPRATITGVNRVEGWVLSRGAHGWRGDWVVNGSGDGLVRIEIEPRVRATVTGVPIRLSSLTVSVEDPHGLVEAIEEILVPV